MKTKPILFSGPMVRALIEGRKTQTRRALKPQPEVRYVAGWGIGRPGHPNEWTPCSGGGATAMQWQTWAEKVRLRFAVGDLLYVRETWCPANTDNGPAVLFKADFHRRHLVDESYPVDYDKYPAGRGAWSAWAADVERGTTKAWRPAIHMPTWVSRTTLAVTDVRVQRLQDITEEDAEAEGVAKVRDHCYVVRGFDYDLAGLCHSRPSIPYAKLWDHINGADSWDANPWVVAVSFAVHKCNVDEFLAARKAA